MAQELRFKMVHHRRPKPGSQTVLPQSEPLVENINFSCTPPTEEPALQRITDPLPFSKSVAENLAWAAAFIDRAGYLTQDYELLEKRLHAAVDTIGNYAIEMTLLCEQLNAQGEKVAELEAALANRENSRDEIEKRLARSRDTALKEEKELVRKLRNAEKALKQSKNAERRLKAKLDKTLLEEHEAWAQQAEHDEEDHASIDAARDALEQALQEKAALQAELDSKNQELTSAQEELEAANEHLGACKVNCEGKEAEIALLREQLDAANQSNTQLSENLDAANAQLAAKDQELADVAKNLEDVNRGLAEANERITEKDSAISTLEANLASAQEELESKTNSITTLEANLAAAQDELSEKSNSISTLESNLASAQAELSEKDNSISTLQTNLATANEERDQKAKELEDLQKSSQDALKALQDKIDELTAHDLEDHQQIQAAEEAKQNSDNSIKDLQDKVNAATSQDADLQRQLEAEQEAKRAVEAELERVKLQLEEANKPKLPNTVTLSNPIPIVGSLSGSADNYDDIFYPVVSPFPVTLYDHASTNVFVSINGVFSLDQGDRTYNYKTLPCRDLQLPEYILFPFWCDLFIYKDTPQGIYYEVAGEAPSRTLCVEWYVSRYGDQNQYYHFNMTVEEARPNIVTYKYLQALDQGGACTIGAQGPNGAQLWSYNEKKALPGVQVVIDTSSGSITEGTFPVPQQTNGQA